MCSISKQDSAELNADNLNNWKVSMYSSEKAWTRNNCKSGTDCIIKVMVQKKLGLMYETRQK